MIDRIRQIIKYYKLSNHAFAKQCRITPNTLQRQVSGIRNISLNTISSILNKYNDISAEWLLRGEGEMLRKNNIDIEPPYKKDENERINKLIDTISLLHEIINDQKKREFELKNKNKCLEEKLAAINKQKAT